MRPLPFYCFQINKASLKDVKIIKARVENANNILYNDTRFATMGYEDGIEHFNNIELSKQQSVIKVFFA